VSAPDALTTLWHHQGQPNPPEPGGRTGTCARCNTHTTEASRVKAVVSDKFTGWDQYTRSTDPLWCPPCTWGHTNSDLRTRPWLITLANSHQPTRAELTQALTQPLTAGTALSVPISRHKHIVPQARWAHVVTDDRTLPWTPTEAARFMAVQQLRTFGFSETALHEPVARYEQLITLAPSNRATVMTLWEALTPWRADSTYMHVACIASRPGPKDPMTTPNTRLPLDDLLATSPLPPLDGPDAIAEKLVLLIHRGVDWDVWGGARRVKYWDALTDRVRAATYAGPTLSEWWQAICTQITSAPKYPEDRADIATLIAQPSQRDVLDSLQRHAATLVLRVRVYSETQRQQP
jgi:hypothetical protein